MSPCLPSEVLEQLLRGTLAGPEALAAQQHVAECAACRAALDRLSDVPELRHFASSCLPLNRPPTPVRNLSRLIELLDDVHETGLRDTPAPLETGGAVAAPLTFLAPPQQEGDLGTLGRYRVLAELGRGGMGIVLRAYDTQLRRTVALKVLRPERADEQARARFVREARAAAGVEHDNVVPVYTVENPGDGPPYLVMQHVAGPTLRQRTEAEKRLDPREAARICRQVAEGLAAAHHAGLIHRDIKPANILRDTGQGRARIMDFGLVRVLEQCTGTTHEGMLLGTPAYMSPEQIGEPDRIDQRSDVYSLGVTLYESLTGEVPFRGTTQRVLQQILNDEPAPPRQLNDRVPRDLQTICLKAMAKAPPRRYQTPKELGEDLMRWLNGEPIQARPTSRIEKLRRWCRRNPALAAVSAACSIALIATAVLAIVLAAEQYQAATKLRHEQEQTKATLRDKQRLAAELALDRGLALCEQGQIGRGLLWLSRSLEMAADEDVDLRHAILANLRLWSSRFGPRLRTVLSHTSGVAAVAFSPACKTFLVGGPDGNVRLWETATGRLIWEPRSPWAPVCAVAFAKEGSQVMTAGRDSKVQWWDVATGKPLGEPLVHRAPVRAAAMSPDGHTLLTGGDDGIARLWDVAAGRQLLELRGHENDKAVSAVAFSPDGQTLVTGSLDGTAQLWDAASGAQKGTLRHPEGVLAVAFSPSGQTILTGGSDQTARRWLAAKGEPFAEPLPHQGAVYSVAFSADGDFILTGSNDRTARLWAVDTGKPLGELVHQAMGVRVAFSPDGRTILTGGEDGKVRLWDLGAKTAGIALHHQAAVQDVAFHGDGRWVLTCGKDWTARLWNAADGKELCRFEGHQESIETAALSPDGQTVVTGSKDGTARLWDVATAKERYCWQENQGCVVAVTFSPDGRTVLAARERGNAQLYEVATGRAVGLPLQGPGQIASWAVAFSPDSKRVLIGFHGKSAVLWEAQTGKRLCTLEGHTGVVAAVAFSPDGRTALTGSTDHTARLWDVATGQSRGEPLHHQHSVRAVAFSPDGFRVLTGSFDGTARLWDAATGKPLAVPPFEHRARIRDVAFRPDGSRVLTASFDHTARLWDAATGKPLGPALEHKNWAVRVAFNPDGQTLLTASSDGTARLWPAPPPLKGETERIVLWTQVITGMELDQRREVHVLDGPTWAQRHQRLEQLGGPPE
jgi:WD40 repeat protein